MVEYGWSFTTASKMLYEFWYNVVKAHYGKRAQLVHTDTSSYIFTLECEDVYNELGSEPLKSCMDYSKFSKDHPLFDDSFKGVPGRLKSVTGERLISEVVALKPKMFSMMIEERSGPNETKETFDGEIEERSGPNETIETVDDEIEERSVPNKTLETFDGDTVEERFQPIIAPCNTRSQWERTLAKTAFNCLFKPRQDLPGSGKHSSLKRSFTLKPTLPAETLLAHNEDRDTRLKAIMRRMKRSSSEPPVSTRGYQDNNITTSPSPIIRGGFHLCYASFLKFMYNLKETVPKESPLCNIKINIRDVTLEDITDLVKSWINVIATGLEKQLSEVEVSGITVQGVTSFHMNFMVVQHPIRLGTYVPYPTIRGKQCILNPKSASSSCLIQCICAYLCLSSGKNLGVVRTIIKIESRCRKYIKTDNLDLPLSWENLSKIETLNKVSIFIYLLVKSSGKYSISLARKGHAAYRDKIVPLLLLEDKHVALIKDFNQYIKNMKSNQMREGKNPIYCHICLMQIYNKQQFSIHEEKCDAQQTLELHPPDTTIKFRRRYSPYSPSHVGFYSFECLLNKTDSQGMTEMSHRAVAYSYIIIDRHGSVADKSSYCGPDAVNHFVSKVQTTWKRLKAQLRTYPVHMTNKSQKLYRAQTTCGFCLNDFKNPKDKYRHHKYNEEYDNFLTAYCLKCKFECLVANRFLNMFSCDTSNDFGIILAELALEPQREILVQSTQEFKLMKVSIDNNICLVNSLYLLKGNLANLAEKHVKDGKSLKYTHMMMDEVSSKAKTIVLSKKLFFCNDYVSNIDCLKEEQLPPIEAFNSHLNDSQLSSEDYDHAQRVYELGGCKCLGDYLQLYLKVNTGLLCDVFTSWLNDSQLSSEDYDHAQRVYELGGCKCLGDYLQLYLKVNTGLLCDVFTSWRKTLIDLYQLDVAYYESLSSFAWDALLLNSKVEFDAIHDYELYDLIQGNLKEDFTSVVKQYSQADNIHLNPQFNSAVGKYIVYLEFNNLYFTCMMEKLPRGDIHKLPEDEKELFVEKGLENHSCKSIKGYWILCDTKQVSPRVAQETDELPLVLAHRNVQREIISEYSNRILEFNSCELPKSNKKLVASHLPQKNYLVSLDLLQLLMKLGLEVECVHAVYEFSKLEVLENFNTNINQRIEATDKEKCSALNYVNSLIFDKSLMNINKYSDCHDFVINENKFLKFARNPCTKWVTPVSQDRMICTKSMKKHIIDQPTYIHFHILQMATKMLYEFWYNVVKAHYGKRAQLVYTDTSSYIFTLECEDVYNELGSEPLKSCMDFSNFSKDHPLFDDSFKGVPGRLKSVTGERLISEVVALKPKMFSMMVQSEQQSDRTKDLPFHYKSALTHDKFKKDIFGQVSNDFNSRLIPNEAEQYCTSVGSKLGLHLFDDKRYVLSPHHSLAFGHPDILDKYTRPVETTETIYVHVKETPDDSDTIQTFKYEKQKTSQPSKIKGTFKYEKKKRSQSKESVEISDDERRKKCKRIKTMKIFDDKRQGSSQSSKIIEAIDDETHKSSQSSKSRETFDNEIGRKRSGPSETIETIKHERQMRSQPRETVETSDERQKRSRFIKTIVTFGGKIEERPEPNKFIDDKLEARPGPIETIATFDDALVERSGPNETIETFDDEIEERSGHNETIETVDAAIEESSRPNETLETIDDEIEERSGPNETIETFDDDTEEETSAFNETIETFDGDTVEERFQPIIAPCNTRSQWERTLAKTAFNCLFKPRQDLPGSTPP
nr:uncharacterized protein LOC123747796 [Procambarus clarkii]